MTDIDRSDLAADDDCKPGSHPHSDRPNWRPEDDPVFAATCKAVARVKQRVHQKRTILRTLARLKTMVHQSSKEELAELLLSNGLRPGDVQHLAEMLEVVADRMLKQDTRPKRKCAACGAELNHQFYEARPGARYCSAGCRQHAYRKRINPRLRRQKRNTPADRYASRLAENMKTVSFFLGVLNDSAEAELKAALEKHGASAASEPERSEAAE
jgi:hypothetical protein